MALFVMIAVLVFLMLSVDIIRTIGASRQRDKMEDDEHEGND
jgi:hypothetical protein